MSRLRLIYSASKRAHVPVKPREQLTDEEFARKLMAANHGPTCAAYLVKKFKRSIHKMGYFVTRIMNDDEMPMWFSIAMQHFTDQTDRWEVREIERNDARLWKVIYRRRGLFARGRTGTHLRVV